MARPLRVEYAGACYHVINRGLERRVIFREEADYARFLEGCLKAHRSHRLLLHAYALLPNHYHLYVETPEAHLSRAMRDIDGLYTQGFNRRYSRVGPLFQGRYKAILVDKDRYSLELVRYIHLNPVRAKLAVGPAAYRWTSYPAYLGQQPTPQFLETRWLLSQFSPSVAEARTLFERFTLDGLHRRWEPSQDLQGGLLLGTPGFCERIKERFIKEKQDGELTGLRQLRKPLSLEPYVAVVASLTSDARLQRKLLIYVLRRFTPLSLKEIGHRIGGMTSRAVAQTVFRLEGQRHRDHALNQLLSALDEVKL